MLRSLRNTSFGTDLEGLSRKAQLEKNLETITRDVKPYWAILDKLINQVKHDEEVARQVLAPDRNFVEKDSVRCWFNSEKWNELETKYTNVFNAAIKKQKIGAGAFTDFALFTRFVTSK